MASVTAFPVNQICVACLYVFALESLTVKTCALERPPRIQTAIQFPAVLGLTKGKLAVVTEPASMLVCCTRAIGAGALERLVREKFADVETPAAEAVTL